MLQSRRRITLMLFALIASFFTLSAVEITELAAKGGNNREPRLEGILVNPIGANRIAAVRAQNGQVVTIFIPLIAKVERNDVRAPLTAFKVGDRVQARFTPNGSTVTKFEGVGP